jgi:Cys-rich repeat protein
MYYLYTFLTILFFIGIITLILYLLQLPPFSKSTDGCKDNNECPEGICENNKCVQCGQDTDCPKGVCENNKCVQCSQDTDCSEGVCKNNKCVQCGQNSDCINGSEICSNGKCKIGNCIKTSDCKGGMVCSDNKCSDCTTDSQCETKGDICVGNGTKRCGNFTRDRIYTNNQIDYVKFASGNPYDCTTACEKNKDCESWTLDGGGCRLIGGNACSIKTFKGGDVSSGNAIINKCDEEFCSLKFKSFDKKCTVSDDCKNDLENQDIWECIDGKCSGYALEPPYLFFQPSCGLSKSPVLPTDKAEEIGKNIAKSIEGKTTGDPCSFKDYSTDPMTITGISNYCTDRPGGGDMLCSIDPSVNPTPNFCIPDKLCSIYGGTTAKNKQGQCIRPYA